MQVYRVSAVSNDNMSLVADVERMPLRLKDPRLVLGPGMADPWEPPPLVLAKGRKKFDADFWSYDHDEALVVSDRVAEALAGLEGVRLVPFRAELRDTAGKPAGELGRTLLAVTRLVDAVDAERTVFKPYGDRVLDWDTPGATVFDPRLVPVEGLFRQPTGASSEILAGESFRSMVEAAGWTGLTFKEVGR